MTDKRVSFSESDVESNHNAAVEDEDLKPLTGGAAPPEGVSLAGAIKPTTSAVTATGLKVLILLAVQNCSKNLLLRYVMKEKPQFLTSAAVIGVEMTKLYFEYSVHSLD